ncbi:MAG: hypothetical protein ACXVPU_19625, partial [Bacteroidia bacterium]
VFDNLKKVESILLIIIGIGLILKISLILLADPILTISFSTLAIFYFLRAYKVLENENMQERFFNKLLPFGWSINCIGILFLVQGWQGFDPMLVVGSMTQFAVIAFFLFLKNKKGSEYKIADKSIYIRSLIIAGLAFSLHICPKEKLIENHIISKQVEITANKSTS